MKFVESAYEDFFNWECVSNLKWTYDEGKDLWTLRAVLNDPSQAFEIFSAYGEGAANNKSLITLLIVTYIEMQMTSFVSHRQLHRFIEEHLNNPKSPFKSQDDNDTH